MRFRVPRIQFLRLLRAVCGHYEPFSALWVIRQKEGLKRYEVELKDSQTTSAEDILNELDLNELEEASVADWKTEVTETLPPDFQGTIPSIEEIETELSHDIATGGKL
jgi:hypothetical protein